MGRVAADLVGQRFGRLLVGYRSPVGGRGVRWWCRCDCGGTTWVATEKLTSGHTRSCGCLRQETAAITGHAKATHGMSKTRLYAQWNTMLARCYRRSHVSYEQYGGRGIAVCDRWRGSFEAWLEDMGLPPGPGMEIDRIDTNGNYEPGNCRWATAAQNTRNRRVTPMFTHEGRTMALGAWAEECGVPYHVLKDRMRAGWTLQRAMTTQPRRPNGKTGV